MKVLHIITSLKIGGAEVALCNLLEYWRKQDSDTEHCVIYIYGGPCVSRIKDQSIPVYQIKGLFSPYDFLAMWRLAKLVKKLKPDILHSALWSANIIARLIAWMYTIPLISDLHSDCRHHGWLRNSIDNLSLRVPRHFVAVSRSVTDSFLEKFKHHKKLPDKTRIIHNGIQADKLVRKAQQNLLPAKDLGLGENDFVIGSVGRLHPIKRYDILIKAFAKFCKQTRFVGGKTPKLCLVGDGSERQSLEELAHVLGVGRQVKFMGAQTEVYRYYPLFDCFALSSQSEGLSIALLEALSFGLPIVTTSEKKTHDVITNGVNGFVVLVNNEKGLVDAFNELYTNENVVRSMSKENIKLVASKFQMSHVFEQYASLYKKVLAG